MGRGPGVWSGGDERRERGAMSPRDALRCAGWSLRLAAWASMRAMGARVGVASHAAGVHPVEGVWRMVMAYRGGMALDLRHAHVAEHQLAMAFQRHMDHPALICPPTPQLWGETHSPRIGGRGALRALSRPFSLPG